MEETTANIMRVILQTCFTTTIVLIVYLFLRKKRKLGADKNMDSTKISDLPDVNAEYTLFRKAFKIVRIFLSYGAIPIVMFIAAFIMYLISEDPLSSFMSGIFAGIVTFYITTYKLKSLLTKE